MLMRRQQAINAVSQKTYHETDDYVPSRIGAIVASDDGCRRHDVCVGWNTTFGQHSVEERPHQRRINRRG